MNLVMGTMFIVLPAVWFGALSWAGISVGTVMGDAISKGTSNASKAAAKSGDLVNK
ncbi:membrane protein [Escherichia coli]|nr:membrane protein [Escherichia coli]